MYESFIVCIVIPLLLIWIGTSLEHIRQHAEDETKRKEPQP